MRITRVDTIRLAEFPNLLFVEVHTDEGLVGLGETFLGARAVEAYVHETVAPYLIGRDPLEIERHAAALQGYLGSASTGVEMRGNSAADIALWDVLGQAADMPLYQLLGGASRDDLRIYNTCAGPRYIRERPTQAVDNWGLAEIDGRPPHRYDDLHAFLHRPEELAADLLDDGITAMKIWPFDVFAERNAGRHLDRSELDRALDPLRRIRAAVGSDMDVMIEFHGLWNLPTARQIVRALEELEPFWLEDLVHSGDLQGLSELTEMTHVAVAAGETLAGRRAFRDLLDRRAVDVAIVDASWAGGVSEAKAVAALGGTYGIPVVFHDCTGPVALTAGTHLAINAQTTHVQEAVRAFYRGWYRELVTELPPIERGRIRPLDGPGLGTRLHPEVRARDDATVVSSPEISTPGPLAGASGHRGGAS